MPSGVRRKRIIAGLIEAGALLCTIIVFAVLVRPQAPAITFDHIGSVQARNGFVVTFGVTNRTAAIYAFSPIRLECRNGLAWDRCADGIYHYRDQTGGFASHSGGLWDCHMKKLPTGSPLRVVMSSEQSWTKRPQKKNETSACFRPHRRLGSGGWPWLVNLATAYEGLLTSVENRQADR
jgi:hypothetical protein